MNTKLRIPKYAKTAAKKGLELRKSLPKSKQFGITQKEANKLGIDSGVTRAKRIVRNDYMPLWEAKKVANFGNRFKNCKTPKCEGAHLIWGGRRFEKLAKSHVNKVRKWQTRKDGVKQRYWKKSRGALPPGAKAQLAIEALSGIQQQSAVNRQNKLMRQQAIAEIALQNRAVAAQEAMARDTIRKQRHELLIEYQQAGLPPPPGLIQALYPDGRYPNRGFLFKRGNKVKQEDYIRLEGRGPITDEDVKTGKAIREDKAIELLKEDIQQAEEKIKRIQTKDLKEKLSKKHAKEKEWESSIIGGLLSKKKK